MKKRHLRYFLAAASTLIIACSTQPKLTKVETGSIPFNNADNNSEDKAIAEYIAPYKKAIDAEMNALIIVSESSLVKDLPESGLGNMVSDYTMRAANDAFKKLKGKEVDMCLLNNGGLRTSLPKGNITRGKIYELMPFENEIVVLTLSGKKTKELFDYVAYAHGMPMAGVKFGIKDTLPGTILIQGKAFDENKNYTVCTSDYLASGGDKMRFFKNPVAVDSVHVKIRTALIDYLSADNKNGIKLNYKKDGRIYYEQ